MPDDLRALADAHGVATEYLDWNDRPRRVPPDTVRAVLAAMDVAAGSPQQIEASLRDMREAEWRRLVAPTVVLPAGADASVSVSLPLGEAFEATVRTADGVEQHAALLDPADGPQRRVDGVVLRRAALRLPTALPLGAHELHVRAGERVERAHLLVVPPRCPVPQSRSWGWQVQLYALRSERSWGIGDFGDLRDLVGAAGEQGAGFVLLNPLHAAMPVLPQQNSPYSPASRRFCNPLYLRVEECDGYALLPADERTRIDALAQNAAADNRRDRIDRDAAFVRKMEALALIQRAGASARNEDFERYRRAEAAGLRDFATAAALAERHGGSFSAWPEPLRNPRSDAVSAAAAELSERIAFHEWLQWQCDRQLAAAAAVAEHAGMPVGLITDLAVGVDPGGADAWALQADLAQRVNVGAPPDAFNQQGQDWGLPPLRPDRLPETGFAPFRHLVRSALRHAGGLRIDHAMGLFRLYWIPHGASPGDGTYVRYPAEALLGVLALEAEAAGATIVGEDLGTVEKGVPETLRAHGVLGSRVVWFERTEPDQTVDEGVDTYARTRPLPSADYPRLALTSVSTHDLPTAAGYFADEATRIRGQLGQLGHDLESERMRTRRDRDDLLRLLLAEGVLDPADRDDPERLMDALHAFIAKTPSLLAAASLADGVGDLRQPNLPGTLDEYPNWRLPLATPVDEGGSGDALLPPSRPLLLGDVLTAPGVQRTARILGEQRGKRARED